MANIIHPSHLLCTVGAKVIRDYLQCKMGGAGFEARHVSAENKKKIKRRSFSEARGNTKPEESLQTDLLPFQLEILNATVNDSPKLEYFDLPILMNLLFEVGDQGASDSPLTKLTTARDILFELNNPEYALTRRWHRDHLPEFKSFLISLAALETLGFESSEYHKLSSIKYQLEREIAESQRSLESWYFQCYGSNDQVKMDITDEVFSSLNLLKVSAKKLQFQIVNNYPSKRCHTFKYCCVPSFKVNADIFRSLENSRQVYDRVKYGKASESIE